MKKILILTMLILAMLTSACGGNTAKDTDEKEATTEPKVETTEEAEENEEPASGDKKVVTATTSFLADMVKQLVDEKDIVLNMIVPAGDDPHLYLAKPEDVDKIKDADLLLYHGLHFEGKMVDILEISGISVSRNFKEDQIGEMEDEEGQMEVDPHFWFDLGLYKTAFKEVAIELAELFPEQKDSIQEKEANYLKELDELDEYVKVEIAKIPEGSRYLITPHDAFNYFARSYGIEVMAPQGVSTDSEVSVADIQETVDFIVEHKVKAVFAESTTSPQRMEKLRESAEKKGFEVKVVHGDGQELYSDSLAPAGEKGDEFIEMYKHNVDLIVANLV